MKNRILKISQWGSAMAVLGIWSLSAVVSVCDLLPKDIPPDGLSVMLLACHVLLIVSITTSKATWEGA